MIYRKTTSSFVQTELDGELVLMNTENGSFHSLKSTGLAIWQLTDGVRDSDAIKEIMMMEYEVDEATCEREIANFFDSMIRAGIVTGT